MADEITVAALAERIQAMAARQRELEARVVALEWKVNARSFVAQRAAGEAEIHLNNSRRKGTP